MIQTTRQRGVSLVELMVALALLGAVAVLTAQLVIRSTKLMGSTARASLNPDVVLATEWLRRDLYEATAVFGLGTSWHDEPLVMQSQQGGWVGFALIDGNLVRTNAPPGGLAADHRVVLNGVTGWRWKGAGSMVELEISVFVNPHAHENLTGTAGFNLERRTERVMLALRGRPDGRAW